ncbi:DUF1003 domain-containing protein [Rhizobium sp. NRK18]|jgi:uncharacterized membrane protein|uniref:DUF1003 domain-containing protein n=1 Tax=Rhizobium sp. NRK18 TaxID=2964667 RepID=UPI0021C2C721|nr:DUF1003 domain-containing protein [Rhizobium sp. NRK18]MCQ2003985.1 DUF1003 domain-containing protein [Rhizobium sp. NRK18]
MKPIDLAQKLFGKSHEQLGESERRVLKYISERRTLSTDTNEAFDADKTFGERLADNIATFGGSWSFIMSFGVFMAFWVIANTVLLTRDVFDPYPFVFLNLVLSMLAALQAPIIMMSQNRQAARDRFEAAKDYEVNLKAELEVLALHQKIDMQVLGEIARLREDVARLAQALERPVDDATLQ